MAVFKEPEPKIIAAVESIVIEIMTLYLGGLFFPGK